MPEQPPQILLRPNRRALLVGCLPPLLVAVVCLGAMLLSRFESGSGRVVFAVAGLFLVLSIAVMIGLLIMATVPRLALTSKHLLVYLRGYQPYRVPLEAVECFFLGQGTAGLQLGAAAKSAQVIVRLAERATDWHQRPVKRSLGEWQDGYITIRGTWCEPISEPKLRALNSQLAQVKRERGGTPAARPGAGAK